MCISAHTHARTLCVRETVWHRHPHPHATTTLCLPDVLHIYDHRGRRESSSKRVSHRVSPCLTVSHRRKNCFAPPERRRRKWRSASQAFVVLFPLGSQSALSHPPDRVNVWCWNCVIEGRYEDNELRYVDKKVAFLRIYIKDNVWYVVINYFYYDDNKFKIDMALTDQNLFNWIEID